jgi:tetratricopeptide (TPR) repeat protein/KaiC/GvpD/RAD55 family RecA-like ATPase
MASSRVTEFAFRGLPYVFTPAGLPLVEKSAGAAPSTSVLVRGAAGTGKSTLALALADGIARFSKGIVLYLVTEAALSDVQFKAEVLKLESAVRPFDEHASYKTGTIVVSHLIIERPESVNDSTEALQRHAVETADRILTQLRDRQDKAGAPIRALVIDGLGFPEIRPGEPLTRRDLIAFLQTVEAQGVSPILVEETGAGSSDLFTFVVDVVLALALAPNPDSGALHRQLIVSKSRYSDSSAGPHDAVLDAGTPALWTVTPSLDFGPQRIPVGFFFPVTQQDSLTQVVSIGRGAVLLSRYDKDRLRLLRAWQRTPGLASLHVGCGPVTSVHGSDEIERLIPAAHGPAALLWGIHDALRSGTATGLHIGRLEYLLRRPRFAIAIPELLDVLVRRGLLVCIHGSHQGLQPIDEIADFAGPGAPSHWIASDILTPVARTHRLRSVWPHALPGIERPTLLPGQTFPEKAVQGLREAAVKLAAGDLGGARECIVNSLAGASHPTEMRFRIDAALLLDRLGMTRTALSYLANIRSEDALTVAALGWAHAEIGDEGNACRVALDAIDRNEVNDPSVQLWHTLWARFTDTGVDLSSIFGPIDQVPLLQVRLLAQAACGRGNLDIADALLAAAAKTAGLSAGNLARLHADLRLESKDPAHWNDTVRRYEAILGDQSTTVIDRGDILHNLGLLQERLGKLDAAIELYKQAYATNALLEPAGDRLAALGVNQ